MESFIFCILATFGLSSAWLYSPGFEALRDWWLYNMGPFAPLAYCQLCCSFWLSMPWIIIWFNPSPLGFVGIALACAGVSWMLGGITNYFLWGRARFEKEFDDDSC